MSPWIWRTFPDWNDDLIDYITFGATILGNSPNAISAKISGVRFWHLLVGMPDFTLRGGRYTPVLKSVRRNSRVSRKIPVTLGMLYAIALRRNPDYPQGVGIACAAVVGFFFRFRGGEQESLRWMDASLSIDDEGGACLRLNIPRSQTDKYNECHIKVLNGTNRPLRSVRHMALWMGMRPETNLGDDKPVFNQNVRRSMSNALKLEAVAVGADRKRVSNHSLRSGGGGASLMFSVCFEMETIKRRGRCASATFRQYIWRDEHILSNISRGMLSQAKNHGRGDKPFYAPRRAGGQRPNAGSYRRLVDISKTTSGALRQRKHPRMGKEGWAPMRNILSLRGMLPLGVSVHDVYDVVAGKGENAKLRFELSADKCMIRCAQGHSAGSGVRPECLPVAPNVQYVIHGASLEAAKQIAKEGLSRRDRLHIHFYECDKRGQIFGDQDVRCGPDGAIAISPKQCRDDGIVFYRPRNHVILSEGINGSIGAQYFRFIHRMRRGPTRRKSIFRHIEGCEDEESEESDRQHPQTMFTQTNADDAMHSAVSDVLTDDGMQTVASEECPWAPALSDIAGLNPFLQPVQNRNVRRFQTAADGHMLDLVDLKH